MESRLVVKPGKLLRAGDKTQAVGVVRPALDKEMNVVRHVAVRKKREALFACSALNLRTHSVDGIVVDEESCPAVRTERQEILISTEVIERLQVFRLASEHAVVNGNRQATWWVRLKGGHYFESG